MQVYFFKLIAQYNLWREEQFKNVSYFNVSVDDINIKDLKKIRKKMWNG